MHTKFILNLPACFTQLKQQIHTFIQKIKKPKVETSNVNLENFIFKNNLDFFLEPCVIILFLTDRSQ